jgi:hypothetical protein
MPWDVSFVQSEYPLPQLPLASDKYIHKLVQQKITLDQPVYPNINQLIQIL